MTDSWYDNFSTNLPLSSSTGLVYILLKTEYMDPFFLLFVPIFVYIALIGFLVVQQYTPKLLGRACNPEKKNISRLWYYSI